MEFKTVITGESTFKEFSDTEFYFQFTGHEMIIISVKLYRLVKLAPNYVSMSMDKRHGFSKAPCRTLSFRKLQP